jgi:hypothetical protein
MDIDLAAVDVFEECVRKLPACGARRDVPAARPLIPLSVNGDSHPLRQDGNHSARNYKREHTHLTESRKNPAQLTMPNQRLPPPGKHGRACAFAPGPTPSIACLRADL